MGFLTIRQARLENWTIQEVSAEISIAQFTIEVSFDAIWQIHYLAYIICDESSWKQRKILIECCSFLRQLLVSQFLPRLQWIITITMAFKSIYENSRRPRLLQSVSLHDLCTNFLCREFSPVLFSYLPFSF